MDGSLKLTGLFSGGFLSELVHESGLVLSIGEQVTYGQDYVAW